MPKVSEAVGTVREKAREFGLYLPVGAYAKVINEVSDINRKSFTKLYGNLIDLGQDRVEPVQRRLRTRATKLENQIKTTSRTVATDVAKTAKRTANRAEAAVDTATPKLPRVAAPKKASDLPIKGYTTLTANEIITASKGLTQTELAKVYKFERANQNRRTVLQGIEGQFIALPLPTYDALTVAQINERIEGLSADELSTIREYESSTKNRTTVLDRINSLI
jgi:hypothetical protein